MSSHEGLGAEIEMLRDEREANLRAFWLRKPLRLRSEVEVERALENKKSLKPSGESSRNLRGLG